MGIPERKAAVCKKVFLNEMFQRIKVEDKITT
jgi:hypothetical protein